ncbi:MAG: hypothetical protein JSW48_09945 [Betaproteobacteria bacterium]|jgi:hypothetical protein|nr:MAG: hypothetical protein JSW48_09945 [Betaproteobacteria bacterium]
MVENRSYVLQGGLLAAFAICASFVTPALLAQNEDLSFEQAQMRTAHARRQMEAMRREVKKAEAAEELALRDADQMKKRYDAAVREAEKATQVREQVEKNFAEAREKWSEEAARLKRIHDNREPQL